jgi:hypothetical protein
MLKRKLLLVDLIDVVARDWLIKKNITYVLVFKLSFKTFYFLGGAFFVLV